MVGPNRGIASAATSAIAWPVGSDASSPVSAASSLASSASSLASATSEGYLVAMDNELSGVGVGYFGIRQYASPYLERI